MYFRDLDNYQYILGVPYYDFSTMAPPNPVLLIKAHILRFAATVAAASAHTTKTNSTIAKMEA